MTPLCCRLTVRQPAICPIIPNITIRSISHIARRHFFIRDMVEAQEIVVPLVSTENNDADFFTKPLPPKRFKMLRRKVMNLRSDP